MADARTDTRNSDRSSPPIFAYSLVLAALVACGLHAIFISGPATRAAAQAELAQTIADEDLRFCEKFGMRRGSAEFDACSRELASIRQRQVERDNAAAQGIL